MKKKKGQAALEFLITYGWAFVIILTALGALAYFGVLRVSPPSRCNVAPEFACADFQLELPATDNAAATVVLSNAKDFTMNVTHASCRFPNNEETGYFYVDPIKGTPGTNDTGSAYAGENWQPGEKRYVQCTFYEAKNGGFIVGDKAKVFFTVTYLNQDIGGFEHTVDGEIVSDVTAG